MDVKARKSAKLLFSEFSTDFEITPRTFPLYLPKLCAIEKK